MRIKLLALLVLSLFVVGCRDSGGGGDDGGDDAPMIDAPVVTSLTVKDVQGDSVKDGDPVTLKGVIVTAIDKFGTTTGDVWVQDLSGGPFSGVLLFRAPLAQVSALAVGDIIDVANAEKDEFAPNMSTTGRTVTELKGAGGGMMMLTKTGTGTVPAPAVVDAAAVAMMDKAGRDAEWEKWEGVLVTVMNPRQASAITSFRTMMPPEDTFEFRITGVAKVQSAMVALPTDFSVFGDCFEKVTGIGHFVFDDLIFPRSAADLVKGGTGCRPIVTTVAGLQAGVPGDAIQLTDVFVTGRDDIGNTSKGIWVSDSLTPSAGTGSFVFTRDVLDAQWAVGAKVSVKGASEEFDLGSAGPPVMPPAGDTVTQITGSAVTFVAAPGAAPTPLSADPAMLANIAAPGEMFEGVLVVTNGPMKVTKVDGTEIELTSNAGAKLTMDDGAFAYTAPTVNTCYTSVVGLMSVQPFKDIRTINPRSAADMPTGAGCN